MDSKDFNDTVDGLIMCCISADERVQTSEPFAEFLSAGKILRIGKVSRKEYEAPAPVTFEEVVELTGSAIRVV